MEIRANAAQFLSEQGKVIASAKTTASEIERAAQKEAAAARGAAAEAKNAAEQQALAAESAAKAATVATDKRIAAEARAAEAQKKAAQMQSESVGAMTEAQQVAYDKQVAAAERAANAVDLAAAKEAEAQKRAATAADAAAASQQKAADLQVAAAEKTAAAQEVGGRRTAAALDGVAKVAGKVSAVTVLALAGVAFGATEMAAKFEKSTMLLVTAGGEIKSNLESVRQGILDISTTTGTSAEQLSEGMYIMEKAGYRGASGLAALKAAAQGAKDENVDLSIMAQAVTDVLLDYGYKMDTAASATDSSVRVTNMLVAASGAAKTTMTDFAGSMAAVVPISSTAKISFDQVGGAIATMTQHGQSAQQSSQNLANLVQSLVRPNNLASAAMSQLGIDTTDLAAHLGERGLSGSLKIVSDAILQHMGPDGLVLQKTMKDNANATAAMQKIIAEMPPGIAEMSRGLLDGSVSIKQYSTAAKDSGGTAGALALQLASLYKANSGVNDQLKAGKPAVETYNAAMRDVFGNVTAARAATMLLMNDSREFYANIQAIGIAGEKTGKDISTWADMQETLSVQMDQTKNMAANLGIELGTKLIPYAKGALGGFSDLVHGFEEGNPVLLTTAGVIGGTLALAIVTYTTKLIVAGVTTTVEMAKMGFTVAKTVAGMVASWVQMQAGAIASGAALEKVASSLSTWPGRFKAATMAAAALAEGLALITASKADVSIEQITNALGALNGKAGDTKDIDAIFTKWDKNLFSGGPAEVNNMSDAVRRLVKKDDVDRFNQSFDGLSKTMGLGEAGITKVEERFQQMGQSLQQMVSGGHADQAAEAFKRLAKSFTDQGGSAQQALDAMPAYRDELIKMAHDAGVANISGDALVELAGGKIPAAMAKAAQAQANSTAAGQKAQKQQESFTKALDDAGVSADGLATNLQKVLDGMLATGMATMDSRDATARFNKTAAEASKAIDDLVKSGVPLAGALNEAGTDFDLTTEAGQSLNSKLEEVARTGVNMAKSVKGNDIAAQKEMQSDLEKTYDSLIKAADGMGIHGQAAVDLTRKLLGIPPNVDVKTWMDDYARQKAADTKSAIESIPPVVSSFIDVKTNADGAIADYANAVEKARAAGHSLAYATGGLVAFANGGPVATMIGGYPGGGLLTGPGTGTSDSMIARVSNGEFVMRAAAVQKYGAGFMSALNNETYHPAPGYQSAQGAASSPVPANTQQRGGNTINVYAQTNATAQHIANEIGWKLATA
jgi:TP901 family phage tail tape measure protein